MKRQITIGEIAEINANSLTQKGMFQEIMYLDTGNITRNEIDNIQILNITMDKIPSRAKRKVKDKTIIYSTVRPNQEHYGFLENPSDNFIVSTGFSTIDVYDDNTDEKFIYYLLTQKHITDYLHTIGENSVSSYPSINPDDIANLKFTVPDLKTQQSITAILSALDKKIALNKQINARLEEMAKTLYDYWFVQFDFPDANGKPYKSSGGEMVFDETLKREIPKGWEVKKIESILTIGSGFPFNSKDYTDRGKYQIVTIKNVQDTYLDLTKTDKVGKIPNNIKEFCILKKGDILISLTGNVGRICFVDMNNLLLNQRVGKFICHKEYLHFFYLLFNRSESKERLEKLANGSSQSNLSPIEAVKDLFVCPSNIVLEQFNAKVDLLFEKLLLNQQQNYHLTQLRDFLLPMLMNG